MYASENAGATWQAVFNAASSDGLIPSASSQTHQTFIRIAAGPNHTLALGLVDARTGGLIGLFYRSGSDAGANWRRLLPTPIVNPGGQAGVNLALAIDPSNSNLVYVMGDNVASGRKLAPWLTLPKS